jgi:predicted transcriptional regulator
MTKAVASELADMIDFEQLTPKQAHAARVMAGLSQKELAKLSGVSQKSISAFETGEIDPRLSTKRAIATALQESGIRLLNGGGVAPKTV